MTTPNISLKLYQPAAKQLKERINQMSTNNVEVILCESLTVGHVSFSLVETLDTSKPETPICTPCLKISLWNDTPASVDFFVQFDKKHVEALHMAFGAFLARSKNWSW